MSWDEAGVVLNIASPPSDSFPLFLSLSGAPNVRALAAVVQWFPTDPTGACYGLLPASPGGTCGSTSEMPTTGEFHGEPTNEWWSISFPPGSTARHCVSWIVTAAGCPILPPAIFTAQVRIEDSNGDVDTLAVQLPATIGSSQAASLEATAISPAIVVPATETMLRVRGSGFLPGSHVSLSNSTSRVEASRVIVLSPDEIAATVAPGQSATPYDLTVSMADGRSSVSPQDVATAPALALSISSQLPRPTNAAGAIRTLALWADQSATVNVAHIGLPLPSALTTDSLLIPRPAGGDTMAVLRSTPSDCIEFNAGVACCPSYVEYNISPPQYATSIGLLQMGKGVLRGTGAFDDNNLPIVSVRTRFADGDSVVDTLRVGRQVRNSKDGSLSCPIAGPIPYFVLQPDDPLNAQLYASGGAFYDAQEVQLPPSKRSKLVSAIRISELAIVHNNCAPSGFTGCQSYLSGIGLWPSFEVRNRHGGSLGLQTQFATAYAGLPYGGYIVRDTLFGAHNTIRALGCMLSCMAMANSFLGDTVTVLGLNKYLALHDGFEPTTLVTLNQVNGQSLGSTVTWTVRPGVKLSVGDTVLFESPGTQRRSPLVTLVTGPTTSQATIVLRHRSGLLTGNMTGVGYGLVNTDVAAEAYSKSSGHPWHLVRLIGTSPAIPPLVETALVDSLPVLLEEPHHYVLARGWRPSFGGNFANGTYVLNDPGHDGVTRLNQNFVVGGTPTSFGNTFLAARSCVPLEANHYNSTAVGGGAVSFVLQGGGRLSITDSSGRGLDFYDTLGGYDGNLPGANAWPDYGAGLDDGLAAEAPVEYVELAGAAGGDYRVQVVAKGSASFGLGASTLDADGNCARAYAEYPLSTGEAVTFSVHVVQGASSSVRIDTLTTAGVGGGTQQLPTALTVRPNPSRGKVELVADMAVQGNVTIELFDIAGRLVAVPLNGPVAAGRQVIHWDAETGGSVSGRAGLYFVRMRTGAQVFTRRLLVTR